MVASPNVGCFLSLTRELVNCFALWARVRLGRFCLELHRGAVLGDAVFCSQHSLTSVERLFNLRPDFVNV